ncbi:nuclear transport factor 2 family protein [Pedobacter sp. ASV28]|uniref:nuclear transport factor 2 family protein n=1 Tax=Pedobacter sp. ASV28 TaxID=2795123 RepID=UPI0018EC9259|nr:nuclear transport factor 2 family protein [Pedobacter sp. ASV28]
MKKIFLVFIALVCTSQMKAQTKDEKAVSDAVEKMRLAMISGDRAELENISSTNLSYGHSSGKIEDKAAFVESIASGKSDFVSIDLKNQSIQISGHTAIVRHELHAKTNDGGKPGEVHLGIMLVWQKFGKDWKLIGRQAFKLPQ